MIKKIKISNVATYTEDIEFTPTEINYFYGSNGSGKTTLSNLIRKSGQYPNCEVEWETQPITSIVYNRDFVKENFSQSTSIKGIFTLGKDTKEAKEFIDSANKEIEQINKQIQGNEKTLNKKNIELDELKLEIIRRCWNLKKKHEGIFKPAFIGFIGTKEKFLEKCLSEQSNISSLLTEEEIRHKCNVIFNDNLRSYPLPNRFEYGNFVEMENNNITSTKIIGREDIRIGDLIKKLNNSDWVKAGIEFVKDNTPTICPFCQQLIDNKLKEDLEGFFDETYITQCLELKEYVANYQEYVMNKINEVENFCEQEIDIISIDSIKEKNQIITQKLKTNIVKFNEKIKSPSQVIELEPIMGDFNEISHTIDEQIEQIKKHNQVVTNIFKEKKQLQGEIWRYIVNELREEIISYTGKVAGINKAMSKLRQANIEKEEKKRALNTEIKAKEAEVTSIIHTANEINSILQLFGFNNFRLSESQEKGFYKIIRQNGEDVEETLSEGEYTFISFLYFYQLVNGSMDKTGSIGDKVVVIDDPISSLDSNVLFIVSNLVKEIIRDCQVGNNGIKQIFVLTHNVYFHKEITFKGNREANTNKESFWMVRKLKDTSSIINYKDNPIQTTYELLWKELKEPDKINTATIFNTLRRILEYYFNILGGIKYEECINAFEGEDKLICRSLISWINDGSHFITDELEMPMEVDKIEKYLNVFKMIFDKMGHINHYEMMFKKTV